MHTEVEEIGQDFEHDVDVGAGNGSHAGIGEGPHLAPWCGGMGTNHRKQGKNREGEGEVAEELPTFHEIFELRSREKLGALRSECCSESNSCSSQQCGCGMEAAHMLAQKQ